MKCHVLYTSDKKYFPHMVTSIYSLLENNNDLDLDINIIEQSFTGRQKEILKEIADIYDKCDIRLYNISDLSMGERDVSVLNAKFFAGEIIDCSNKVLYLDSDTIVVNSLKELFSTKVNHPISAVKSARVPIYMNGIANSYYNSGVMLFNYEQLDNEDSLYQMYDALNYYNLPTNNVEQNLMNIALVDNIGTLDLKYNITPYIYDLSKHHYLLGKFCESNEEFYSKTKIIDSVNNACILHNLAYLNTRVWDKSGMHPFKNSYQQYRKIWDDSFSVDKSEYHFYEKFIPYLNLIAENVLSEKNYKKVKNKVRDKIS